MDETKKTRKIPEENQCEAVKYYCSSIGHVLISFLRAVENKETNKRNLNKLKIKLKLVDQPHPCFWHIQTAIEIELRMPYV